MMPTKQVRTGRARLRRPVQVRLIDHQELLSVAGFAISDLKRSPFHIILALISSSFSSNVFTRVLSLENVLIRC